MADLLVNAHSTAQWHSLVQEAQSHSGVSLDEDLESYLVFLLMRYTQKPELAAKILAIEYLRGATSMGTHRREQMRDVGDQCLLYSGLFPRRAERRRVRVSYYVDLGRSAYHDAAEAVPTKVSDMFFNLAESFVQMMDTLQAMRRVSKHSQPTLDPLNAVELWQDTRSQGARQVLADITDATPVWQTSDDKQKH
jgi:hypothetical protein